MRLLTVESDCSNPVAGKLTVASCILFSGRMVKRLQSWGWKAVIIVPGKEIVWIHPRLCPKNGKT